MINMCCPWGGDLWQALGRGRGGGRWRSDWGKASARGEGSVVRDGRRAVGSDGDQQRKMRKRMHSLRSAIDRTSTNTCW